MQATSSAFLGRCRAVARGREADPHAHRLGAGMSGPILKPCVQASKEAQDLHHRRWWLHRLTSGQASEG